jgi:pyridoxal 5'-phosphate synthase pdxS subunit
VDFIDESEVLTPADEEHHVNKHAFKTPFVCGARDLGEALRRIGEGAAMIRTKGEAGTGNIVEAVRHMRAIMRDIRRIHSAPEDELMAIAKQLQAPTTWWWRFTRRDGCLCRTSRQAGWPPQPTPR